MARPKREALPASAQQIASAFEKAKLTVWEQEGRRLTQAEYARNALPPTRTGKPQSARYLRLILEGKRPGSLLVERAKQSFLNVEVESSTGDTRSMTFRVPRGRSQLDVYQSNIADSIKQADTAWAKRYAEYSKGGKITRIKPVPTGNAREVYRVHD